MKKIRQAKVAKRCALAKREKACTSAIRGLIKGEGAYPPKYPNKATKKKAAKKRHAKRSSRKHYGPREPAVPRTSGYELASSEPSYSGGFVS